MIAGVLETQFTANLDQLRKGMAQAEKELKDFERRSSRLSGGSSFAFGPSAANIRSIRQASNETRTLRTNTIGLRGAVLGLAAAYGSFQAAAGFKELLDTTNRLQNALRVVGHEGDDLTDVYNKLFESAQRNYTSVEALTTLYSRLGLAQDELGKSSDEILEFTDRIALALRVQGTNAQEARGALIQLTQAMGSGVVRAEEFNSIVEGAPSILRAAARGIEEAGGSVAKLRKLVIDGKLSSQAFFDGFMAGSRDLASVVGQNQITIDQALTNFNNELIKSVSQIDQAANVTPRLVSAIDNLTIAVQGFSTWVQQNAGPINEFLDALGDGNRWQRLADGIGVVQQAIRDAGEAVGANQIGEGIKRSLDPVQAEMDEIAQRTDEATLALVSFANELAIKSNTIDPAITDRLQEIILLLVDGKISAAEAKAEIASLGRMDGSGNFSLLIGEINGLISVFDNLTQAANTAKLAASFGQLGSMLQQGKGIAGEWIGKWWQGGIDPIAASDTTPEGRGSGGGRKAKTPVQNFEEEVARMRDRIKLIDQETASVGMLNSVQEQNRVKQDLINSAREKGVTLTEQQLSDINNVALAYGNATQALDDANRALETQMTLYGEFGSAIGDALGALISGSEDAEKALARMVLQMVQAVIQAQILNTIGQSNPAVGSLFSNIIGGIFGGVRALGGPVQPGQMYKVNESTANSEYFMPTQPGVIIPNRSTLSPNGGSGGYIDVRTVNEFVDDQWVVRTTEIAGQVAGQQIKQSESTQGQRNLKSRMNRVPGFR